MFRQHYVREVEELSGSLVHIVSGRRVLCPRVKAVSRPSVLHLPHSARSLQKQHLDSPAKDTAPSDLITSCAFSALQP